MKKSIFGNPLRLSIAVIILVWLQDLIRNVFCTNSTLELYRSIVYLRKGRAWEAIAGHAAFDILGIVIGFILYYGK